MRPPVAGGSAPPEVRTRGVRKRYGARTALARVGLDVPAGAAYVLVGPNGAGKTTLMRILLDLVRPDEGDVRVAGLDPVDQGARVRALCGFLPERNEAGYAWMSVSELLAHHAGYRPTWSSAYAAELMDRLEVRDHTKFGRLSKGEARRVQLVMALAHRPPLLLLDEPTDGLDPLMREEALHLLGDHLAVHETTLLISTHRVSEVEGIGDHLGILREGVLEVQMSRDRLRRELKRYTLLVPDGWAAPPELEGRVVRESGRGREVAWTVIGSDDEVTARLRTAGATVREVASLTLEEAAVALLSGGPGRGWEAGGRDTGSRPELRLVTDVREAS